MSLVSLILTAPVVGYIVDKVSKSCFISIAFLLRGLACFLFILIDDPSKPLPVIVACLMLQFSLWEWIGIEAIYLKALPSDIRGMMVSLFGFSGLIGIVLFSFACGYLYDNYSPITPFLLLGTLDLIFVLAFLCLLMCGKMQV